MTYGVTDDGFVIKPFSVIRAEVEAYQRGHIDDGLILSDESLLGQVNVSHCNQIAELWEMAQIVHNSFDPNAAEGFGLDQVCALTGTKRNQNSKTLVLGQVTMEANKPLPAGSVANLTSQPNARFATLAEVPADAVGGTFDVWFEAETAGATQVIIGQLDEIAEPVSGWLSVDNSAAGITGTAREEDDELRIKRENELEAQGSTNVDAVRADLLSVNGVIDAQVTENRSDHAVGGVPAHCYYCVIRGGAAADIAQALFDSLGGATDTYGSQSSSVTDSQGYSHTFYWDFATEVVTYHDITVQVTDDFDVVDGPAEIKANIAAYVNALAVGGDVLHDQGKNGAYDVTGVYKVTVYKLDSVDPPVATTDLAISATQYASVDVANIDVTVV